ncbi:CAP domain-containing protein [Streptomyces tropicalis]|uniref:CAP domain-containing protein n=1 Tax=Streptomyces tropicalis TaxID=3034234 RepID=A0ABT6AEA2_9ACTN|nr:CAP domain-containing protein [Streptomyces tropicalis]MDF3302793.1 CAP domain-containing protein [Streptomyces tropicalis]
MGRHRRPDAGRAATGRAPGATETHGSRARGHDPRDRYADDGRLGIAPYLNPDAYTRAQEYLFGADDEHARASRTVSFPADGFSPSNGPRRSGHRRRKKAATPVRTGLLGVSAAVALGTVAVATGAVPGLDNYRLGGGSSTGADAVQAAGTPTNSATEQGGTSGSVQQRTDSPSTSRGADRSSSPSRSASPSASPAPSSPSAAPAAPHPAEPTTAAPGRNGKPKPDTPARRASKVPAQAAAPAAESAEAQVLKLVNAERAKAGCTPVTANGALTKLAESFSRAMAAQDFFDHTDPSGATPWDRAAKLGIVGLGGENIARGQADPAAVMDAWMNSPGHRANILDCDFKTLGVGVHFGTGGPWWTQDFGY